LIPGSHTEVTGFAAWVDANEDLQADYITLSNSADAAEASALKAKPARGAKRKAKVAYESALKFAETERIRADELGQQWDERVFLFTDTQQKPGVSGYSGLSG
jgi:hypothetical protein